MALEMPILGNDTVLDLESAFDNDECEIGTDCHEAAKWWAHNPCSCVMRACDGCREIVLTIAVLAVLQPIRIFCAQCNQAIPAIDDIRWERL